MSVIRAFIDRPGETYRGVITTRLGIGFGRALRRAIEESRATPTSTFAPAPDAMEAFKKVLESLQTGVPETIGYGAQTKQTFSEGWNAALNMVYERSEGRAPCSPLPLRLPSPLLRQRGATRPASVVALETGRASIIRYAIRPAKTSRQRQRRPTWAQLLTRLEIRSAGSSEVWVVLARTMSMRRWYTFWLVGEQPKLTFPT